MSCGGSRSLTSPPRPSDHDRAADFVAVCLPVALDVLRINPLAEGDFYPGDLLHSVLGVEGEYWRIHRDECRAASEIVELAASPPDDLREVIERFKSSPWRPGAALEQSPTVPISSTLLAVFRHGSPASVAAS
jgi:hypothetical protein